MSEHDSYGRLYCSMSFSNTYNLSFSIVKARKLKTTSSGIPLKAVILIMTLSPVQKICLYNIWKKSGSRSMVVLNLLLALISNDE